MDVDACEKTGESLSGARRALSERLMEGTGSLLEKNGVGQEMDLSAILEKYKSLIVHACESLSTEQKDEAVAVLQTFVRQRKGITGQAVLTLIHQAADIFALQFQDLDRTQLLLQFDQACEQCYKPKQLFDALDTFFTNQLMLKQQAQRNLDIRPVRLAKQYVQEHFDQNITLDTVCAQIGFSSSYFSVVFKKETGEGFLKYLTRVRMEKAKELLQQSDYSLADICNRVGYNDVKHFTATFKKATNLSPAQYRKLFG